MANEARAARSQQSPSSPWFTSNLTMIKFAKIFKTSSSFNTNLVHSCKLLSSPWCIFQYWNYLLHLSAPSTNIWGDSHSWKVVDVFTRNNQIYFMLLLWELSLSCQNISSWLIEWSPHNHHNHELVTSWGLIHLKLGLGLVKNKEEVIGRNLYTTSLRFEKAKNIHISLFQPFVSPEHSSLQTALLNGICRFRITFWWYIRIWFAVLHLYWNNMF